MTLRNAQSGVTLIEMMVALAIFALIGTAGFSMLDQVLRTQSRTEGRLEALGDLQRGLYLVGLDAAMAEARSVAGSGEAVAFLRSGGVGVRYGLQDGVLRRGLTDAQGRGLADQPLIKGVQAVQWRYLDGSIWAEAWPPVARVPGFDAPPNPRALELVVTLAAGQVRRVLPLPVDIP
ncbi:MAG: type II secretion system protein GspJ [Pseudomonadota bacterium]